MARRGNGANSSLSHSAVGNVNQSTAAENIMEVPQNITNRVSRTAWGVNALSQA